MWLTLWVLWMEYAAAVVAAIDLAVVWGPPLAGIAAGALLVRRTFPDRSRTRVRGRVRILSALRSKRGPLKPLTCPDTVPDTPADTRPDVSGRSSDGGH